MRLALGADHAGYEMKDDLGVDPAAGLAVLKEALDA